MCSAVQCSAVQRALSNWNTHSHREGVDLLCANNYRPFPSHVCVRNETVPSTWQITTYNSLKSHANTEQIKVPPPVIWCFPSHGAENEWLYCCSSIPQTRISLDYIYTSDFTSCGKWCSLLSVFKTDAKTILYWLLRLYIAVGQGEKDSTMAGYKIYYNTLMARH
jgi:hypothetical protein